VKVKKCDGVPYRDHAQDSSQGVLLVAGTERSHTLLAKALLQSTCPLNVAGLQVMGTGGTGGGMVPTIHMGLCHGSMPMSGGAGRSIR